MLTYLNSRTEKVFFRSFLYLQDQRVRIPEQIGVVGFSDNPNASLVRPALTTVSQPAYEIGKTAAQILLNILAGRMEEQDSTIVLETRLVIRDST